MVVGVLQPVRKVAESAVNRLMKGVEDTPEYVDRQKRQVYRAMIEGTFRDGVVSDRERAMLDRLREELGIPVAVATALEVEAQAMA